MSDYMTPTDRLADAPRSKESIRNKVGNKRHAKYKEHRDIIFQLADFDPWIVVFDVTVCYYCRHSQHTDECVWVWISQVAHRSEIYPG